MAQAKLQRGIDLGVLCFKRRALAVQQQEEAVQALSIALLGEFGAERRALIQPTLRGEIYLSA
ncbi:hypothetical protein [Pseudomonas sp. Marseille-QA0892]